MNVCCTPAIETSSNLGRLAPIIRLCVGLTILGGSCALVAETTEVPGPMNAITDVPGIEVGQFTSRVHLTGTTVVLARSGAVAGVDVRGSAPGTRETDLLNPINLVEQVQAVVLSGGSAYGLATADGVMHCLEDQGIGFPVDKTNVVPIVPAAVLYDLGRCGTDFSRRPGAYAGHQACTTAGGGPVAQGNVGAGTGAFAGDIKGGIGTASTDLGDGVMVGALVAVNSYGSVYNPNTGELYGAYLELGDEFVDRIPRLAPKEQRQQLNKGTAIRNTTIADFDAVFVEQPFSDT